MLYRGELQCPTCIDADNRAAAERVRSCLAAPREAGPDLADDDRRRLDLTVLLSGETGARTAVHSHSDPAGASPPRDIAWPLALLALLDGLSEDHGRTAVRKYVKTWLASDGR